MMKTLTRALLMMVAGSPWTGLAHAEGGFCPPGTINHNNGTAAAIVCSPIPGYGQQQAPQRPAEVWQDQYGAIATDGPNHATGSSINLLSKGAAENSAIADCRAKGGKNCVVKITFSNGCAAVATGDRGHGASARQTIDEASSAAQKDCVASGDTNCRIYYKVCSLPVRIQYRHEAANAVSRFRSPNFTGSCVRGFMDKTAA